MHVGDLRRRRQHALPAGLPRWDGRAAGWREDLRGPAQRHPVEIDGVQQEVTDARRIAVRAVAVGVNRGVIRAIGVVPLAVVEVGIVLQRISQRVRGEELEVFQTEGFALRKEHASFGEHIDDGGLVGAHIHRGGDALKADQSPAIAQITRQGFGGVAVAVQIPGVGGECSGQPGVDDGRGMQIRRVDAQVVIRRAEDVVRPVEIGELRIAGEVAGPGIAALDGAVVDDGIAGGIVGDLIGRVTPQDGVGKGGGAAVGVVEAAADVGVVGAEGDVGECGIAGGVVQRAAFLPGCVAAESDVGQQRLAVL